MNVHLRRRSLCDWWLILLAVPAIWCLAGPALAQVGDPTTPTLITANETFVVLPPELVAGPKVTKRSLSPDGRYLLVVQEVSRMTPAVLDAMAQGSPAPPDAETDLVLWDGRFHTSQTVLRFYPADGINVFELHWMTGSNVVLVTANQKVGELTRWSALRIVAAIGAVDTVMVAGRGGVRCDLSPTAPVAVVSWMQAESAASPQSNAAHDETRTHEVFAGLWETGPMGKACVLPAGISASVEWAVDGSPIVETRTPGANGTRMKAKYRLDMAAGILQPAGPDTRNAYRSSNREETLPVRLAATLEMVKEAGGAIRVRMLWLTEEGARPAARALVAIEGDKEGISPLTEVTVYELGSKIDGDKVEILPGCRGVLYEFKGALWVAPVVRMSAAAFRNAQIETLRKIALQNAKQVAIAFSCLFQDYQDEAPPTENVRDAISPYLRFSPAMSALSDFTFTYRGGDLLAWLRDMPDMEDPANTEIGIMRGPGGVAVVYADGHVHCDDR